MMLTKGLTTNNKNMVDMFLATRRTQERTFVHIWKVVLILCNIIDATVNQNFDDSSHHFTTHTVITKYGSLRGVRLQFSSSSVRHIDPVTAYLGIPYASPPVNAYRFMPPVAPLPWGGTRLAVSFPPVCHQKLPDTQNASEVLKTMSQQRYNFIKKIIPHLSNQSEDCLYLNFYVPTVPTGEEIRPGRFPIILIIHGESWEWGSGNEFDGGVLASLGNHIVVTFNYRLGILGFLKTSNQQSNFGLLDVIAALHWVRENGDAFGGDRNRITLVGYRTGAVVANLLLVARIAKGLFQRAVLISGTALSPWALQRNPEDVSAQVAEQLGCTGKLPLSHIQSDLAPCLRKKPVEDLLNVTPVTPRFLSPFAPYVDNVLFDSPKTIMEGGMGPSASSQFINAELLLMFTSSEGVHELNEFELKNGFESNHRDKILRTLVRNVFTFHQQEIFSIVRNEYTDWERPILHPIPLRDTTVEALSDCLVIAPTIQVALIHAKRNAKTFLLYFSHVRKENEGTSYERLGSVEGDIVPYVMGLPVTNNVPPLGAQLYSSPWSFIFNYTRTDASVSENLIHYLSNFARTGDPNRQDNGGNRFSISRKGDSTSASGSDWISSQGKSNSVASGSNNNGNLRERMRPRSPTYWDPFEPNAELYMNMGVKPRMKSHFRGHKMALWLNLIPQIHLPGGPDVSLNHHIFQDDQGDLYAGPVRPSVPFTADDRIPGFGLAPGIGIIVSNHSGNIGFGMTAIQSQTSSPGDSLTTTECLHTTVSPLSQGTRHSVIVNKKPVEVEIHGSGSDKGSVASPLPSIPNSRAEFSGFGFGFSSDVDYDYTTALTVTITVGVCLILLNLVVFSAIMCHRKKGIMNPVPGSDSESRRSSHSHTGETPIKTSYHENYDWSSNANGSPNMTAKELPEGDNLEFNNQDEAIAMNQYCPTGPGSSCEMPATFNPNNLNQQCAGSSCIMHGTTSASPLMGFNSPTFNRSHIPSQGIPIHGSLKRKQVSTPMPDCVQVQEVAKDVFTHPFNISHSTSPCITPTSMHLYMNQVADPGDRGVSFGETLSPTMCLGVPEPPSLSGATTSGLPTNSGMCNIATGSGSSNSTANPSSASTASPNSGNTTLVGVLKRNTSGTPNSTVKKRVQIQEISV